MVDLPFPILSAIVFTPLAGSIVLAFVPRERVDLIRIGALVTALLSFAFSIVLVAAFDGSAGLAQRLGETTDASGVSAQGFQFVEVADWIPVFGIQYKLGVDGIALVLVVLTTTLTWVSILASFGPIKDRVKEYMISFLILEVGMLGVFLALDLFLFYVFWEVVLVPMYLIIGIWGGTNRIYATIKFVLYTLLGSLLMLVAILATAFAYQAGHGGDWTGAFDYEQLRTVGFDQTLQLFAFIAFFLAFAIKVPMFPFHTWLPDAHVEAPTAGSVILAGVLLKLGAYGFIRFALPLYPDAAIAWQPLIIALSLIAIIYGAIVALVQPDLKKLVAYSSVSHMGFVTLGIFIFQPVALEGAILQMVNHGLITGALFLCVGILYERTHDRAIARMGGLARPLPMYAAAFGFFVLASLGLPGLSGFVGEFLVLVGTFADSPLFAAVATLGMVLAAAYLLWMYQRVVFGEVSDFLRGLSHHLVDLTPTETLTLAPLAALVLAFGLAPGLILELLHVPVAGILNAVADASTVASVR